MCNPAIIVSSFLFVQGQNIHSFNTGNILYKLFSGNSSHSDCHSSNIYLFVRGFRSENGMSSTEMSPSRASLAAESAAKFPLMPTWPGTQKKTISLPPLYIILKSELRLDDHILGLKSTVIMKGNQIISRMIFLWNNEHV